MKTVGALLEAVRPKEALEETLGLAREVNGWLNEREPWKTLRADPADAARAVYAALRCIDNLKVLFAPFTPFSSQQVHEMLGLRGSALWRVEYRELQRRDPRSSGAGLRRQRGDWAWAKSALQPGQRLREPSPLFVKLDPEIVEEERQYLGQPRVEGEIV